MKKFAEKYAYELLITSAALLIALLGLCVYVFFVFSGEMREEASRRALYEAQLQDAAEKLDLALLNGEDRLAYHYAAVASDVAAETGDHSGALLYRSVADTILRAPEKMSSVRAALESYRLTGEIPAELTTSAEESEEEEIQSVSLQRVEAAEDCVMRLFGEHNALHPGAKTRNGELVFTGSNAYAIIDGRTGLPVEAAVSFAPAEKILEADACIASAYRFLSDYFPAQVAEEAVLEQVYEDSEAGTFELIFRYKGRPMTLSVRRDNGRVARLTAR